MQHTSLLFQRYIHIYWQHWGSQSDDIHGYTYKVDVGYRFDQYDQLYGVGSSNQPK